MVRALVSIAHSVTCLPEQFRTANEIASLWTSLPIYFTLSMEGYSAPQSFLQQGQKPCASRNRMCDEVESANFEIGIE